MFWPNSIKTDRRKYSKLKGLQTIENDRNIGPLKINALIFFVIFINASRKT